MPLRKLQEAFTAGNWYQYLIPAAEALAEWPAASDPARQREHELLRLRSRDVLEHIERVLRHTQGNRTAAAKILGMSRVPLIAKIKQHRLEI